MQKNSYNYEDLISCGKGNLFGEGNAKLPLPPMLMFDRITEIKKDIGLYKKGFIKAEVVGFSDYIDCGGQQTARDKGKLKIEGKEYLVQDGDVIEFKFNV